MFFPDFPLTRGNPEHAIKIVFPEGVRMVSILKYSVEGKVRTICLLSMIDCKQYS